MPKEQLSDLAVIAIYYSERFEVDEICQAFAKARPRCSFKLALVCLTKWLGKKKTSNYRCCTVLIVLNNNASNLYL